MNIEILNNQRQIKINKSEIKRIALKFLRDLKQDKNCILSLIFVPPDAISRINKKYFNKKTTTDVIAVEPGRFNKDVHGNYLGDIVICPQKAKEHSKTFGTSLKEEIALYVAHGILHLLGYEDLTEKTRIKMERKQCRLLRMLRDLR